MSYYKNGTVSVAVGGIVVTAVDTVFNSQARSGDLFIVNGVVNVVDSVQSNVQLTLVDGWTGPALVNSADYVIVHTGSDWHSTVTVNEQVADLLTRISNGMGVIVSVEPTAKGTVTGGTVIFDASQNSRFTLTNGGVHAWAFLWPTGRYSEVEILLKNGGAFPITMPTGIQWLRGDGTVTSVFEAHGVTLATGPGWNTIILWTPDGGTTVFGRAG